MDLPVNFFAEGFVAAEAQGATAVEVCDRLIANHRPCFWLDESTVLKAHPRLLRRSGRRLFVRLKSGEEKAFSDIDNEESPGGNVLFLADKVFPDLGLVTLLLRYYEGNGYFLVDLETGKTKSLIGPPIFSPDGKRLVVATDGIDLAHEEPGLSIYRLDQRVPTLEYSARPEFWGFRELRWRDKLRIEFLQQQNFRYIPDGERETQWRTLICKTFREEICFEWRLQSLDKDDERKQ